MLKLWILGLPMLFASLFSFFGSNKEPYKKDEALMANIIKTSTKQLSQRYGLVPIGEGGALVGDKSKMESVSFQLRRKLTKEEARILIVEITELYLHNINNTQEIRPYLYDNPFTYNNLEFVVFIHDKDDSSLLYPDLGLVALTSRGTVNFATNDPQNKYIYATDIEEPYEETYKLATGKEYPKIN